MKSLRKFFILGLIFLALFILILTLVSGGFNFFERLDLSANQFMPEIQNNFLTAIFKIFSFVFDTISMIIISLIFVVILWIKKYKKESLFFGILMLVNAGFIYFLKEIVQRARPLNALIYDSGFAFPSGHLTTAIVFFGLLIYFVFESKKSKNFKIAFSLISVFLILLIGFSRIYLNVHWFSDVLGGFALGLFILFFGIFSEKYYLNE